jgi:hypothetical protein
LAIRAFQASISPRDRQILCHHKANARLVFVLAAISTVKEPKAGNDEISRGSFHSRSQFGGGAILAVPQRGVGRLAVANLARIVRPVIQFVDGNNRKHLLSNGLRNVIARRELGTRFAFSCDR